MSCKIDDRLPKEVGAKSLPLHPAIKTPWEKLISFHDAYHYACRHHAVIGAVYQEVLRILVPDYVWGDRIFEKCGIGRDERGDGGKTLEIRGKRRLSARDGDANYQQS